MDNLMTAEEVSNYLHVCKKLYITLRNKVRSPQLKSATTCVSMELQRYGAYDSWIKQCRSLLLPVIPKVTWQ
jgi:hypothetical protein